MPFKIKKLQSFTAILVNKTTYYLWMIPSLLVYRASLEKTVFLQNNRALFCISFLMAILISSPAHARETMGVYSRLESHTYSQIMSIDAFIDNFSGPLSAGNTALTHDLAELGVQYGPWRIGRVLRYDYDMTFSEDTAQINFNIENNQAIDNTAAYDIFLAAEHLRSEGVRIAHQFKPYKRVSLSVGFSWLNSEQFYSGSVSLQTDRGGLTDDVIASYEARAPELEAQAQAAAVPSDAVAIGESLQQISAELRPLISASNFQGQANYAYYRPALREDELDDFSEVDFSAPSGKGFTFDVNLQWAIDANWSLGFEVRDIYSRITWSDAPMTQAEVNGTQAAVDAVDAFDQFVENDVIKRFSGQFFTPTNPSNPDAPQDALPEIMAQIEADNAQVAVKNDKFVQRIPRQTYAHLMFNSGRWWTARLQVEDYHTQTFYHIRGDFWRHFALEWHPKVSAIGVELYHPLARLRLATDDFDLNNAKYLSLTAMFQLAF